MRLLLQSLSRYNYNVPSWANPHMDPIELEEWIGTTSYDEYI